MKQENNQTKVCTNCKKEKDINLFSKSAMGIDGLASQCKECLAEKRILKKRTKEGLVSEIYSEQKSSSKDRSHTMPNYSKETLIKWVFSQSNFEQLYYDWVNSEYNKWKRPSIDRLKDNLPYSLDNIRLVTWEVNNKQSHIDKLSGENKLDSKTVYKYSLEGNFLCEYNSVSMAARHLELHTSGIVKAVQNKTTAGGYQWRYLKQEYLSPIKKNANPLKIAITQLSKDGLVLKEWESGAAIAEHFNMINASSIYAVCKGKSKSAKGFLWKYSSETVKGEVNEINT